VTRVQLVTLAVAITASVLSAISPAFTGYQWRRSGPVLAVRIADRVLALSDGRSGRQAVMADVIGVGRMPVTVAHVSAVASTTNDFRTPGIKAEPIDVNGDLTYLESRRYSQQLPAGLEPSAVLEVSFELPTHLHGRHLELVVQARAGRGTFKAQRLISPRKPSKPTADADSTSSG